MKSFYQKNQLILGLCIHKITFTEIRRFIIVSLNVTNLLKKIFIYQEAEIAILVTNFTSNEKPLLIQNLHTISNKYF